MDSQTMVQSFYVRDDMVWHLNWKLCQSWDRTLARLSEADNLKVEIDVSVNCKNSVCSLTTVDFHPAANTKLGLMVVIRNANCDIDWYYVSTKENENNYKTVGYAVASLALQSNIWPTLSYTTFVQLFLEAFFFHGPNIHFTYVGLNLVFGQSPKTANC